MDIVVRFDFQEIKNAVDQALREALNRFDLKDANIEIVLDDNGVKITAPSNIQVESVYAILVKKVIGRGLSSRVLDRKEIKEIGGMRVRLEIGLIKALDQENAKNISKLVRDFFPKVKANIQADVVRVVSKSIDELQAVRAMLAADEKIQVPLEFTNYR